MYTELLFNSLDKLQTKPLPSIRHICAFSRGVLNVRFMRSHPTLAPRPQICLIEGNGFCAVAGEGELNRRGDLGTEVDVFCPLPQILATTILIQTKSSQRQPGKKTDSLYLWPQSYETVVKCRPFHRRRFLVATKVTNIGYRFSSRASAS